MQLHITEKSCFLLLIFWMNQISYYNVSVFEITFEVNQTSGLTGFEVSQTKP